MANDEPSISIAHQGDNSGVIAAHINGDMHINNIQSLARVPSHVAAIIKAIGGIEFTDIDEEARPLVAFKPDEKLDYNCVIRSRTILFDYSIYYEQCDEMLDAFDDSNIGQKNRVLLWIRSMYNEIVGNLLPTNSNSDSKIDVVRKNADEIIHLISEKIRSNVSRSIECAESPQEDIDLAIYCFVCYCFMKCKILEKPL